jgi:hypothetical protein
MSWSWRTPLPHHDLAPVKQQADRFSFFKSGNFGKFRETASRRTLKLAKLHARARIGHFRTLSDIGSGKCDAKIAKVAKSAKKNHLISFFATFAIFASHRFAGGEVAPLYLSRRAARL